MVIEINLIWKEIEKTRREVEQAAEEVDDLQQGTLAPHIPRNDEDEATNLITKTTVQLEELLEILKDPRRHSDFCVAAGTHDRLMKLESNLKKLYGMTVIRWAEGYRPNNEQLKLLPLKMQEFTDICLYYEAEILSPTYIYGRNFEVLAEVAVETLRHWHWMSKDKTGPAIMLEWLDPMANLAQVEEDVAMTEDELKEDVAMTDDELKEDVAMNPTPPPEAELAEASSALANLRHYDASDGMRSLVDAVEANLAQRPLLTENGIVYASYTCIDGMPDGNWERALFAQRDIGQGEIIAVYIGKVCSSENDVEGDYLIDVKRLESDASDQEDEEDSESRDPDFDWRKPDKKISFKNGPSRHRTQHQKDHVTVDGDPKKFPGNLAAYANYAKGDAANAEFGDYIKPDDDLCDGIDNGPLSVFLSKYFRCPQTVRRFASQDNIVWPVLVARQGIPKGTEIRVDYGDEYREQMLERGIPRTALENSEYKNLTWSYPQGP